MKNYSLSFLLSIIPIALIMAVPTEAIEPADTFIIQNIEYQNFDGTAKLEIETNEHVDCIIYELEDPYRIVIDPLDTVWCDFEESVYFDEGMVKSIKFVKGREIQEGPGSPYYPFDFVAVELKNPYPYKFSENDYVITLNIGQEKPSQIETEEKIIRARMIEEKIAEEFRVKEEEFRREEAARKKKEEERKITQEKLKIAEKDLTEEKERLGLIEEELAQGKKEIEITKGELDKEKTILKKEKIRLAEEKVRLKEELKKVKKMKFEPRPVKDFFKEPLPPDYFEKALTLEDCIQIAMSNSLAVKVAKDRVKLAKLKVNEAFRELFPELSFILDETRGKISDELFIGRKLGFEFKQVIFHGGEQMYLWEQSKANLKVVKENLNKRKEEIIFSVSRRYYEAVKAINKYNFQKELLEDIDSDFKIAKKEYEFGLLSQIDFMNVESAKSAVFHTLLSYENNLSLAKLELNKTMNIDMNTEIKIDSKMEMKEIEIDLDKCMELALKFRPEYRISYLNTEVAGLTEKIAKSQTFPQIDIFGRYLKARELLEPTFESLDNRLKNERVLGAIVSVPWGPHTIDYQKKITKLAPTVTTFDSDTRYNMDKFRVNLFDNMARASDVKNATVNYKEALDELNKAQQDIHTDIREALFSIAEAEIKIKNTLNNIELYNKELEVANIKKGLNETSFYELIQAKTRLYGEKALYADAVGDHYIAIAQINKAIGLGGYFN